MSFRVDLLLLTTQTNAFTAAYNSSTSDAIAINPNNADAPPMFSSILATGRGQKVRTPYKKKQHITSLPTKTLGSINTCVYIPMHEKH